MQTSPISERVRQARVERGYTQRQLGEKLKVSQAMISKLESKPLSWDPQLSTIQKVAKALNVERVWLMFGL